MENQNDPGRRTDGVFKRIAAWVEATFPGHKNAVTMGLVGLVLAILLFVIGFWRTLLIAVFVTCGVAVGQVLDGDPKLLRALRRWLNRND